MSSESTGRSAAPSSPWQPRSEVPTEPAPEAPVEVLEFIRYCYRRRGFGWPELYDEMCAVAARGGYRGMDYDSLGRLGIGFSLRELPRLAALASRVVAEERAARQAEARRADARQTEACQTETRPTEARRNEIRPDGLLGAAVMASPAI